MRPGRGLASAVLHLACRLVPAALLLWAGVIKVADRQSAILSVDAYDVLPRALVTPVATLLPWAEIAVGLLLVTGLFVRVAGAATAALVVVYVVGMGQAKARGLQIDCGCFSVGGPGSGVSWWDILRDLPLLGAGLYLARRPHGPLQLDRYFFQEDGDHDREEDAQAAKTLQG